MSYDSDTLEYVLAFAKDAEEFKSQYLPIWSEVLANFMLSSWEQTSAGIDNPYQQFRGAVAASGGTDQIVLKDAETHKALAAYAGSLIKTLFGDRDRGYIRSRGRGWEDATMKAPTVDRLLRYCMARPGNFRTLAEAIVDMLMFGTAIINTPYRYEQRNVVARTMDEFGVTSYGRTLVPRWDDVCLSLIDVQDFLPDPENYRLEDMCGAGHHFRISPYRAKELAAQGRYDRRAVERAVATDAGSDSGRMNFRRGLDQPMTTRAPDGIAPLCGIEYWGEIPVANPPEGVSFRKVTIIEGELAGNDPWPLTDPELPYKALMINPVCGRFYGIGPGEVARYDQDFADSLKRLTARAILRMIHPPVAFDPDQIDSEFIAMLRPWTELDAPIPIRGGPASVGALRYDARPDFAFAMAAQLRESIQATTGATGAFQGEEGPDREAASVGIARLQRAAGTPEAAAMVLESECLPAIGLAILKRYQQYLDDDAALRLRIGDEPPSASLADIMGDFDIEFIGSRLAMTRQEKLQALDRLTALGAAVPAFMLQVPWDVLAKQIIGEWLQLPELAADVGSPEIVKLNALAGTMLGRRGAAGSVGGSPPTPAPSLPEAQLQGTVSS